MDHYDPIQLDMWLESFGQKQVQSHYFFLGQVSDFIPINILQIYLQLHLYKEERHKRQMN